MNHRILTKEDLAIAAKLSTDEERLAYLSQNHIQLPDEMLNHISGGSDDAPYVCGYCDAKFYSYWDTIEHTFEHLADML